VVHGDQVGMVQRTGEPRLLLEAVDQLGVTSQGLVDDLERDVSPQPRVPGAIHLGHSPAAKGREHLVRPKPGAPSQAHAGNLLRRVPRTPRAPGVGVASEPSPKTGAAPRPQPPTAAAPGSWAGTSAAPASRSGCRRGATSAPSSTEAPSAKSVRSALWSSAW